MFPTGALSFKTSKPHSVSSHIHAMIMILFAPHSVPFLKQYRYSRLDTVRACHLWNEGYPGLDAVTILDIFIAEETNQRRLFRSCAMVEEVPQGIRETADADRILKDELRANSPVPKASI